MENPRSSSCVGLVNELSTKKEDDDSDPPETMEILFELATLLDTGLDRETLAILVELIEQGVHPQALARVVLELRRELLAVRAEELKSAKEGSKRLQE